MTAPTAPTPVLTERDLVLLYWFGVDEQLHDLAWRTGLTQEAIGLRLANLCGMCRETAYRKALTARSTP